MHYERKKGRILLSTDQARLDFDVIHGFLSTSYWTPGVARDVVERAARGSLAFGLYEDDFQIGYARVVTDRASFAYLADVFILPSHQRLGFGRWLLEGILEHPELQGLRRWMLATADAHELYARFGFRPLAEHHRYMERRGTYARDDSTFDVLNEPTDGTLSLDQS